MCACVYHGCSCHHTCCTCNPLPSQPVDGIVLPASGNSLTSTMTCRMQCAAPPMQDGESKCQHTTTQLNRATVHTQTTQLPRRASSTNPSYRSQSLLGSVDTSNTCSYRAGTIHTACRARHWPIMAACTGMHGDGALAPRPTMHTCQAASIDCKAVSSGDAGPAKQVFSDTKLAAHNTLTKVATGRNGTKSKGWPTCLIGW